MVQRATAGLEDLCRVEIRPYLPVEDLARACRGAAVNAYLWSSTTFHHKLVELLCCRRPIVCFPGERAESLDLARHVAGSLIVCRDETALRDALSEVRNGGLTPVDAPEKLQHLTWEGQAERLEAVMHRAVKGVQPCNA